MQVPDSVATAVATSFRHLATAPGGVYPSARVAAEVTDSARRAIADLVGGDAAGVVSARRGTRCSPSSPRRSRRTPSSVATSW